MNNTFNTFIRDLGLALAANRKVGESLLAFRAVYNKSGAEAQFTYRMKTAEVIAASYGCEARRSSYNGEATIAFDGERKGDARNAMRYYFPAKSDSRGSNNKADAVKALLTRYTKLTAAEKRRFLASI